MGNYNSQYQNYYNAILNKYRNGKYYQPANNHNLLPKGGHNWVIKRIMQELIGVLLLFCFVIACKVFVTPQTVAAYNYSKSIVNENFDLNTALKKVQTIKVQDIQDKAIDLMDKVRSRITGEKTVKEHISSDYIIPVSQNVLSTRKNSNNGLDFNVKEDTPVLCCFDGIVESIGEENAGKYVVVDHGDGIETKYAGVDNVFVSKGSKVKKSQVIAKSKKSGKSGQDCFHFELLYMGKNIDPQKYFKIK